MGKRYARGQLKNGEEFQIVDLYPSDLDMILQLQKKAASQLPSPQLLQCLSAGEYAWILSGHGRMIGVFVRNRLVGCRAFLIPGQNEEYLGEDAGIGRGERSGIIYSEISIVDPAYRGNGLQNIMGGILMKGVDRNRFRYVLATVAPFNIASMKDKFRLGMEIGALKKKYDEKWRYIFIQDLSGLTGSQSCRSEIFIKMDDIPKQQHLLESGYRGKALEKIDGEWYVRFCDADPEG